MDDEIRTEHQGGRFRIIIVKDMASVISKINGGIPDPFDLSSWPSVAITVFSLFKIDNRISLLEEFQY